MIGLSFVAFVDILGFGDMVVADCESATPGDLYLPSLKSAIHEALAHAQSVDAKIVQFSDSIVVSSPFVPTREALQSFVNLVRGLQSLLFLNGILCRGGISHGRHFHDDVLLFSQALIDAYRLENTIAVNPRILISKETFELIFPVKPDLTGVLLDNDGQIFIDFLYNQKYESVHDIMNSFGALLSSKDVRLRSKVTWLFNYTKYCFEEFELPDNITMRSIS